MCVNVLVIEKRHIHVHGEPIDNHPVTVSASIHVNERRSISGHISRIL